MSLYRFGRTTHADGFTCDGARATTSGFSAENRVRRISGGQSRLCDTRSRGGFDGKLSCTTTNPREGREGAGWIKRVPGGWPVTVGECNICWHNNVGR